MCQKMHLSFSGWLSYSCCPSPATVLLMDNLSDNLVLDRKRSVRLILEIMVSEPDEIQVWIEHTVGRCQYMPSGDQGSTTKKLSLRGPSVSLAVLKQIPKQ